MKILFLAPYPPYVSPSQRFRFEHYLPYLKDENIRYNYYSFVSLNVWNIMFADGNLLRKIGGVIFGFIKRFLLLFTMSKYDFVFIHREVAPAGPPVLEFIISKLLRKKIIYDFDDAIWTKVASSANSWAADIKCTWKVKYICKWSYITTVGNDFLASYASNYCKNVVVIPTVVNTEKVHNKVKNQADMPLTIGWTGTFTNFYNLDKILVVIKKLKLLYEFTFLIIADKDPHFTDFEYEFIKWNKETEIEDLLKLNIGLMPLNNSQSELGKCGFKAIQYLSLGIPAIVSPVGANCKVVQNNVVGFWANTEEEWIDKLTILIKDTKLRSSMGTSAIVHIANNYSVKSTLNIFLSLFKKH